MGRVLLLLVPLFMFAWLAGTGCSDGERQPNEETQVSNSGKPKPGGSKEQAPPPPPPPSASRKAPPKIEPIVVGDVRYEQVLNAELIGQSQRTGYLAAYDSASSDRLWILQVYEVKRIENLEADVQDVFFRRMSLRPDGRSLEIENERGNIYIVDVDEKKVRVES